MHATRNQCVCYIDTNLVSETLPSKNGTGQLLGRLHGAGGTMRSLQSQAGKVAISWFFFGSVIHNKAWVLVTNQTSGLELGKTKRKKEKCIGIPILNLGHYIRFHILLQQPINKKVKPFGKEFLLEPGRVERHQIGGSVLIIVSAEVFLQPSQNISFVHVLQNALIHVRTVTAFERFRVMGIEWELPNTLNQQHIFSNTV